MAVQFILVAENDIFKIEIYTFQYNVACKTKVTNLLILDPTPGNDNSVFVLMIPMTAARI
jgi:hypothetical protein